MRIVLFCHSLISDWNHGNAHFLRGIAAELLLRGHQVRVHEPRDAWSVQCLKADCGTGPLRRFARAYPTLKSIRYNPAMLDLKKALQGADLVLVHEWNDPKLVAELGAHRKRGAKYKLLFHDTHHRAVTSPHEMARYDLSGYDGVLAFGKVLRDLYLRRRWTRRAWTWHEAADTRVFRPIASSRYHGDLIWVGNWGDEERTAELHEFLLGPAKALKLRTRIHGVRYPEHAISALDQAGIDYAGWLANHDVPAVFARFRATVHVPRRPYVKALPGIPTIRVFEALACGMPLLCSPWEDAEQLFTPGRDYLIARDGQEMKRHLQMILRDPDQARALAMHGHKTVLSRHTCAHRVDELLNIHAELVSEDHRHHGNGYASRSRKTVASC